MRFQFSLSRGICASCWCHSCLMFIVRWRRVVCAQEVILRYEDEPHLWHCVAEEVPWFRQLSGLGNAVELLTFSGCFLYNSLGYLNQQYRFSVLEVLVVLCYREKTEDTGSYDLTACQIPYDVIDCYSLQGFKHSYVVIDGYPSTKVLVVLCVL